LAIIKTLQDNESLVEMASAAGGNAQMSFYKEGAHGGLDQMAASGFQNPMPRITPKFNLISE
jgi:hypothetical protein